jgi:GT2 family glycosyltransferase
MIPSNNHIPLVSIILVTWNSARFLPRCLDSLSKQTFQDFEIVLVDNGSNDATLALLRDHQPRMALQVRELGVNRGFSVANNLGANLARSRWLALLNTDAFPEPLWLENMITTAENHPQFNFFASRQLQENKPSLLDGAGDVYHVSGLAWRRFAGWPADQFGSEAKEVFSPCAAAGLYSRQAFLSVGGFDEDFFSYQEDVDLAFRLRLQGFRCLYVSTAVVHHVGSGILDSQRDFALYHWQRNYPWCFIKCMPSALLWEALPAHLLANFLHLTYYSLRKRSKVVLAAKRDALCGFSRALIKRREIQATRKASIPELASVMSHTCLEPYLLGYHLRRVERAKSATGR